MAPQTLAEHGYPVSLGEGMREKAHWLLCGIWGILGAEGVCWEHRGRCGGEEFLR